MSIIYFKNVSRNSVFINLFNDSLLEKSIYIGEIVTVKIVGLDRNFVIVDAGLKSEGFIPINEFKDNEGNLEISIGDYVPVVLMCFDNGFGDTIFSREKAKRLLTWFSFEKAIITGEFIVGTIVGKVKGGLIVMCNGIRAFLPGSLVDIKPIKDTSFLEGQFLEFKVIKLDRIRNNVVLSRKAVIERNINKEKLKIIKSLYEGSVIKGVVKNITDYGVFVDLGGIDGLLHITDLAWRRIRHPSEILSIGQGILAKVLKYDKLKNRVSLGMKQLEIDPWIGLFKKYPRGTRIFGKVTNITDYGAFIEIEKGIEGLVHTSEMSWTNKNISPSKVLTLGKKSQAVILYIDEERRRISLGVKYFFPNPWKKFFINFKKGSKVVGLIKSISDFGIFINLPGNIDGLLHFTDLSWNNKKSEDILSKFKKGNFLTVKVLSVDIKKQKISLGLKQFFENPFDIFVKLNKIGSKITGIIKNISNNLINVKLTKDNIYGCLKIIKMKSFFIGEKISVYIINYNYKKRLINLSLIKK